MGLLDEDMPQKADGWAIGDDLAALSLEELGARIALLKAEIARIEAVIAEKEQSRRAADSVFAR